ncbi:hypothetical protein [Bacteroides sp.]|uniref:hypothetical protein n=1 Tax=Bacteroides sp. TaxID=29523 RepID=UPI0023C9DF4E|nr:hypothetical protein [Bacteroides sp.]MDE6217304.1 hypothetical protein [Bacteroides sp.]
MGNWERKQEEKKDVKEKDRTRREKLAGYFFDTSKLILAGVVIGGITPLYSGNAKEINLYVIIVGVIATILLAWIANKILKL